MPTKPPFDPRLHLLTNNTDDDDGPQHSHRNGRVPHEGSRSPSRRPSSSKSHHRGNGHGQNNTEADDAALARMIQEQILAEERQQLRKEEKRRKKKKSSSNSEKSRSSGSSSRVSSSGSRSQEEEDRNLMMRMQRQEMEAASAATRRSGDDSELARRMQQAEISDSVNTGFQNQLDYARRLQQQAFQKQQQQQQPPSAPAPQSQHPPAQLEEQRSSQSRNRRETQSRRENHRSRENRENHQSGRGGSEDAELAWRMQELEEMGMGRERHQDPSSSFQRTDHQQQQPPTSGGSGTGSRRSSNQQSVGNSSHSRSRGKSQQEEDDERLARMIAESGESLRFLQPDPALEPQPVAPPAPAPQPPSRSSHSRNSHSPKPSGRGTAPKIQIPTPMGSHSGDKPDAMLDPPGMNLAVPGAHAVDSTGSASTAKEKKKRGFFGRKTDKSKGQPKKDDEPVPVAAIPAPIPPPPVRQAGPIPHSTMGSHNVNVPLAPNAQVQKKKLLKKAQAICCSCHQPASSFLIALDKKYHAECFTCVGCHLPIDSTGPFAYMADEQGEKHPLHRKCYAELYGVKCAVCRQSIPAGPDGKVSFVKHPFFDTEQMCPRHANEAGRRCTGCHRFEPEGEPFADLNDSGRCTCFSCCRTVVVDGGDAQPLWAKVVDFFEFKLSLPIWEDMREVPILVVGYEALNDQMLVSGGAHGGSSQIMTRGLCLTEHQSGRKFKLSRMKFNKEHGSFRAVDVEEKGFTFFQIPDASKTNPDASVTAILCLSGLPRDLTASVLAHEALHAWIKLHPRFDIDFPIPAQVEEGCAQLIAMLFLTDGLEDPSSETYGDSGPSDEKLRQYFKFSIETDDHEIYGEGYRRAAQAYADIGVEALLSHVVLYKEFPKT